VCDGVPAVQGGPLLHRLGARLSKSQIGRQNGVCKRVCMAHHSCRQRVDGDADSAEDRHQIHPALRGLHDARHEGGVQRHAAARYTHYHTSINPICHIQTHINPFKHITHLIPRTPITHTHHIHTHTHTHIQHTHRHIHTYHTDLDNKNVGRLNALLRFANTCWYWVVCSYGQVLSFDSLLVLYFFLYMLISYYFIVF
jgi:hypothetical protein